MSCNCHDQCRIDKTASEHVSRSCGTGRQFIEDNVMISKVCEFSTYAFIEDFDQVSHPAGYICDWVGVRPNRLSAG